MRAKILEFDQCIGLQILPADKIGLMKIYWYLHLCSLLCADIITAFSRLEKMLKILIKMV